VLTKEKNHLSSISHVWMPWSMQFNNNYFIHEWPYWPGGEKISTQYSLGCIRLHEEDSKTVYDWADIGTELVIHASPNSVSLTASENLKDGDLMRAESDNRIYVIKHINGKRFKRLIPPEAIEKWYPHLAPLEDTVNIVTSDIRIRYASSRWIRLPQPDLSGTWDVYEIGGDWTKHRMVCHDAKDCGSVWSEHGYDPDEIYTVTEEELNYYPMGQDVELRAVLTLPQED